MNKELSTLERLQAPNSKYFKPIQTVTAVLAILAATLTALQATLPQYGIEVPALVLGIAKVVGIVSATIAGFSQLTVDWDAFKQR